MKLLTKATRDVAPEQHAIPADHALLDAREALQQMEADRMRCAGDYRAAVQRGDGPTMVALRHKLADLDELVAASTVAAQRADIAYSEAEIARLDAQMQQAREEEEQALRRAKDAIAPTWSAEAWAQGKARRSPESVQREMEADREAQEARARRATAARQKMTVE